MRKRKSIDTTSHAGGCGSVAGGLFVGLYLSNGVIRAPASVRYVERTCTRRDNHFAGRLLVGLHLGNSFA
jgi:hypothetical protein